MSPHPLLAQLALLALELGSHQYYQYPLHSILAKVDRIRQNPRLVLLVRLTLLEYPECLEHQGRQGLHDRLKCLEHQGRQDLHDRLKCRFLSKEQSWCQATHQAMQLS